MILTLGASISTLTVWDVAAVFGLFAASVATLAATLNVTVPLVVGVIVAVYVVLSVVFHAVIEAVAVPEMFTSACSKPETASVKVMVASKAPFCRPGGAEILTSGAVVSGSGKSTSLSVTFTSVARVEKSVIGLPTSRSHIRFTNFARGVTLVMLLCCSAKCVSEVNPSRGVASLI